MAVGNGARESLEAAAPRNERAARIRAARAHAGIDQAAVAQLFGVSVGTIKRMESGKREITTDEMLAVAELCNVPVEFMLSGFESIQAAPVTLEEASRLRDEIAEMVRAEFAARFEDLANALLADSEARQIARDAIAHLRAN